ncbi:MAG TPA: HAD hydrolase family protein, partial [Pyrinomonadaceae bacterium]|nr:HAD hydrolase family protein [Pyrinomonadaceae bacterium]
MTDAQLSPEVLDRARKVKLLLMDCDGVLTDGRLYFAETGESLKVFHARDGQGIVDWHKAGFRSGIISGRNSKIVDLRAGQLGIEFVWQGRSEKVSALNELLASAGVSPDETVFVGDDTPDTAVMRLVGLAVAVGDAHDAVKAEAHYVTRRRGGRGAVRE